MFVCSAIIFLRVFIVIDYFDIYSFSREISKIVIILPGNTPLEVDIANKVGLNIFFTSCKNATFATLC